MTDEYTLTEAAIYLGVSVSTLRKAREKRLLNPDRRNGVTMLFTEQTLHELCLAQGWQSEDPDHITIDYLLARTGFKRGKMELLLRQHGIAPQIAKRGKIAGFYSRKEIRMKLPNLLLDNK